jgi:transcriptional regulator with XRE-family HTH domain
MKNNLSEMKTGNIMKDFIESTAKEIAVHREERIRFITELGRNFYDFDCSDEWALVDGHREIIGNTFRIIREACGFSLEYIAERCRLSAINFERMEKWGFLNSLDDNYHEAEIQKRFIARIYVAWLKNMIEYDYRESDEILFRDILNFNDAVILDIDELLGLAMGIEDADYIDSLESIKASYEAINDILGCYREIL